MNIMDIQYAICMKPFTLTPRDIGAVHILCVISCVNQFMNYLDHTVSIYRPLKLMLSQNPWEKALAKNVDVCRFWCKISRPLKSVGVNKVTY